MNKLIVTSIVMTLCFGCGPQPSHESTRALSRFNQHRIVRHIVNVKDGVIKVKDGVVTFKNGVVEGTKSRYENAEEVK